MAQLSPRQSAAPTSAPKPRPVAAGGEGGTGRVAKLRQYVDDVIAEMRKVAWPSREETRNLTLVVIGLSVTLGLFLGGIDLALSSLYTLINPITP
jgi:preprotein translocase subunit SecE